MNPYDRYLLPLLIDCVCGIAPVQAERAKLIPRASGKVLEIGMGTGRNLPFYQTSRITALCGLDPGSQMQGRAVARAEAAGLKVEMLALSAEKIPADDAHFDTVVSTFTLCTIPDVQAALLEMRRVLKPDGMLLFCEHGQAPDASVRGWQNRLTPLWKPLAGGCHLNRNIPALIEAAGFDITELQASYLQGPRPMTYTYRGSARAI